MVVEKTAKNIDGAVDYAMAFIKRWTDDDIEYLSQLDKFSFHIMDNQLNVKFPECEIDKLKSVGSYNIIHVDNEETIEKINMMTEETRTRLFDNKSYKFIYDKGRIVAYEMKNYEPFLVIMSSGAHMMF